MKDQTAIDNMNIKAEDILNSNIQRTLDSMSKQIAVLDKNATIVAVNRAWKIFADQNGLYSSNYCVGENYIEICKKASEERRRLELETVEKEVMEKTEGAEEALKSIEQMFAGEIDTFSVDYPCHAPDEKRWFRMSLISFAFEDDLWIMVSHENITQPKLAEINLINSENKLKSIIQSIPDAMCMIDIDQNIVWTNDVATRLYGPSLVGQKCYRAYGRWNNICHNCIVHKTFRDGKVHSGEYAHFDIDGNERILSCSSSVAGFDESGNISHVMEIMRDITEKKQNEKFLKFMRVAVDTTADGVYWINPDGSIKYVNQAVIKYTGYTQEEITRLKIVDIDPNMSESSWSDHWSALRYLKTIRLETTHRTKDGNHIPFEITANHVAFEGGDEYNFAVVRNISERKQAEREIRRLSQAIEYSPVSVVITDINGNIEYVNRKFSQVTGYTREEAIGQNPKILNSGEMPVGYYKNLWKIILSGKEWRGEFVNRKKSGETYWESASISPVIDENGKIAYFVAIKEDTTSQKKIMEELEAAKKKAESATRAKSDFLATMSHEIRTPMNAIVGMSHLMMDTELNDIQYGYLSNIQAASDSLLSIINDILDLSKIEAGKMEFESVEFEWNQIIEKIFNVLKFTANEKKLELIYSFGKNIPRFMVGDPMRLSQVIMNLVGNAVKYTKAGEVSVHTELIVKKDTTQTDDNKEAAGKKTITLRVSIKDTGIGISESELPSLFTPFTQADSSTTRQYGGTGLGLVIAKRIVNKMGGDIDVQSVAGKGSTFSFTVVFNTTDQLNEHKQNQINTSGNMQTIQQRLQDDFNINALSGLNVMVVEPHTNSRRALTTTLKSLNMRVMAASNGDEAVQLMELASETRSSDKPVFDLVMINSTLPNGSINCAETLSRLESHTLQTDAHRDDDLEAATRNLHTKYIVMHDFTLSKEAGEIAEQFHVDNFLPKPVTPSLLIRTIIHVMSVADESTLNAKRVKPLSAENIQEQFKDKHLVVKDKHLLVVDDDEINCQIVVAILKKTGIKNISVAVNGAQAVRLAQEHFCMENAKPFDLILMDVEMPIMDGLEATRKIRELGITTTHEREANSGSTYPIEKDNITLKDIPIIALTGHALDEYREKCFKAGMNGHIDKPIQPEKLFAELQKWLM